jgi:HK97 family phage major capsid protein
MAQDEKLRNIRAMMTEAAQDVVNAKSEAHKAEADARFLKLNDDLDARFGELEKAIATKGYGNRDETNEQRKNFSKGFAEFTRKGVYPQDLLAKSDGYVRFDGATAGNLLMPAEISSEINRKIVEISPVLQVVDVKNIGSSTFDQPVQTANAATYWEGEDEASELTKDAFKLVKLTPFELRSRVFFTQSMLDDAAYDLEGYTMQSITDAQAQKIGTAVLSGSGFNQPAGMNAGLDSVNSTALALKWDDLVNLQADIKPGYLADDASTGWMFTRATRAAIRKLALTNGNAYTWEPNGQAGYAERLLGSRIFLAASGDLADATIAGAFTSGQVGILYGNFKRAYTVAMRMGTYVIRDIYSGSDKFRVFLNVMQRVDGRVTQSEAAKRLVAAGS